MQPRKTARSAKKRTAPAVSVQIGKLIHSKRIEQKLSLAEVSRYVGVSEDALRRYEAGTREIPMNQIFALSNCLNIAPSLILGIINKLR